MNIITINQTKLIKLHQHLRNSNKLYQYLVLVKVSVISVSATMAYRLNLMEDNLLRKTTFYGRGPFIKEDLKWKKTFPGLEWGYTSTKVG